MDNEKIDNIFLKPYNPKDHEDKMYELWEKEEIFNPDVCIEKGVAKHNAETFSTIMPPPNANGRLHCGHALDMTLKDIATRFNRMRGKRTLFLPGADHAGFETQMVFEKKLSKEGKSRFHIPKEELYDSIYDFTMENKKYMENDIRQLGTSCDWSRQKFTLDSDVIEKVQKTFIKMYEEDLVYRGERIVHWNPKFQTALSDIETEFIEQTDPFYYFQYGPFVIGTVRPETKFGDKYVVMNPKDERYTKYTHGQKIELEWINGPITATIIKDESVDIEFGTGVMTITPWHDQTDFEIAERHNLEKEQIIDWNGKLLPIAKEFSGMRILEARPLIIDKLKEKGLLVKVEEDYKHAVRICERTKVPVEPQIKSQWFVKMKPLADKVIEAVEKENKIDFLPEYQKKTLLHWMHNTLDWNISRQIVWGIPIPAWFKTSTKKENIEVYVGTNKPEGEGWKKDPDTFDTWFSSGQWPLLTLNFPESDDFKDYYPTNIMETGSDLVFKWVPRMIMFGLYLTGEIPFKTVYFHGMVNDAKNQKMSKSKGNVISPSEISSKFGTDALRMALAVGNTPGGSIALSEGKVKAYKNFSNKIWNASRFVFENSTDYDEKEIELSKKYKKYINEFEDVVKDITDDLESFRFHLASEKIYQYFWHTFADKIIEESKEDLKNEKLRIQSQYILNYILRKSLIVLHPFMPFITEKIWQEMPNQSGTILAVEKWPVSKSE